jgi:hypothetical protein
MTALFLLYIKGPKVINGLHFLSFPHFYSKIFCFCHIQAFFYTIMNIFITLLENVNKSHTPVQVTSLLNKVVQNGLTLLAVLELQKC